MPWTPPILKRHTVRKVYIPFSAKRSAYFCKSIAIEMGGVSPYSQKCRCQGSICQPPPKGVLQTGGVIAMISWKCALSGCKWHTLRIRECLSRLYIKEHKKRRRDEAMYLHHLHRFMVAKPLEETAPFPIKATNTQWHRRHLQRNSDDVPSPEFWWMSGRFWWVQEGSCECSDLKFASLRHTKPGGWNTNWQMGAPSRILRQHAPLIKGKPIPTNTHNENTITQTNSEQAWGKVLVHCILGS